MADDDFHYQASKLEENFALGRQSRDECIKWIEEVTKNSSRHRIELVHKYNVLSLLVRVLSYSSRSIAIEYVCRILRNLSMDEENLEMMLEPKIRLLALMAGVIRTGYNKARSFACEVISNLAACDDEHLHIVSSGNSVVFEVLKDVVRYDAENSRLVACTALDSLSSVDDNKIYMASHELGLLEVLAEILKKEKGEVRVCACSIIGNLSFAAENQCIIAASEFGILEALVRVIKEDCGNASLLACVALGNLSSNDNNSLLLAAPDLGLFGVLSHVLRTGSTEARATVCGIIANLSMSDQNKVALASTQQGILRGLREEIQMGRLNDGQLNACAAAAQIASVEQAVDPSLTAGLLPVMLFVLVSGGPDPTNWSSTSEGRNAIWALCFFFNLCQWSSSKEAMRATGVVHALLPIAAAANHRRSLQAELILASLVTSSHSTLHNGDWGSASSDPVEIDLQNTVRKSMPAIMEVLCNVAYKRGGEHYRNDFFQQIAVLRICLHLVRVDMCGLMLATAAVAEAMHHVAFAAIDKSWGKERTAADVATQILYHMVSLYDQDADLILTLLPNDGHVLIKRTMSTLRDAGALTGEGRRCLLLLLGRLERISLGESKKHPLGEPEDVQVQVIPLVGLQVISSAPAVVTEAAKVHDDHMDDHSNASRTSTSQHQHSNAHAVSNPVLDRWQKPPTSHPVITAAMVETRINDVAGINLLREKYQLNNAVEEALRMPIHLSPSTPFTDIAHPKLETSPKVLEPPPPPPPLPLPVPLSALEQAHVEPLHTPPVVAPTPPVHETNTLREAVPLLQPEKEKVPTIPSPQIQELPGTALYDIVHDPVPAPAFLKSVNVATASVTANDPPTVRTLSSLHHLKQHGADSPPRYSPDDIKRNGGTKAIPPPTDVVTPIRLSPHASSAEHTLEIAKQALKSAKQFQFSVSSNQASPVSPVTDVADETPTLVAASPSTEVPPATPPLVLSSPPIEADVAKPSTVSPANGKTDHSPASTDSSSGSAEAAWELLHTPQKVQHMDVLVSTLEVRSYRNSIAVISLRDFFFPVVRRIWESQTRLSYNIAVQRIYQDWRIR